MPGNLIEPLWQNLRYAWRTMRRDLGFTTVAVLSLALGTGANTAVFSLIDTLMLRMLPVAEPRQLVELLQHYPGDPRGNGFWSWPSYEYYRDHSQGFAGLIAASAPSAFTVRNDGLAAESVNGQAVSGNFYPVLGVKPALGRLIGPGDIPPNGGVPGVAVMSWSYWKDRFDLDPRILGTSILVQNQPVTVIGVAPPEFFGLQVGSRTDIWTPLAPSPSARLVLLARLKPGVSIEQARAEMTVLYQFTIDEEARSMRNSLARQFKVEIEPAGAGLSLLRDHFAKPLLILMAVVGLVLLIACTNVAGLVLARGAAREHEMAVLVSLGAGRLRLVGQVLTECLLLSGIGTLLGVFLAYLGTGALVRMITSGRQMIGLPGPLDIPLRPDAHMLLFTTGVALLSGLLFGLVPAWNAFASQPAGSLREMANSGETRFGRMFGKSLVVAQVALSVVLLTAAGLFVRHLSNLEHIDLGFRRDHVLLVALDPSRSGYQREQLSLAYQELLGRFEQIPGVQSVSMSGPTPLSGGGASGYAAAEGFEESPEDRRYIAISYIAPKYFATMGVPLVEGRDFNFRDQEHPRIAIISESMARFYFPGGNPVGKHVTLDHVTGLTEARTYEIVGVAKDAHYYEIREPAKRTVYLPAFQNGRVLARDFLLRTKLPPEREAGAVRSAVSEVLKTVPVSRMTTLNDQVDASIVPERIIATLSGWFGALGTTLAAIGLYGLLAYTVTRRITEFGIRMALGATGADLNRMVMRDALVLLVAGLIAGIPVAIWSRRFTASFLQDDEIVSALPIAFGVAAVTGLALIAALLPARRAARVDPLVTLRHL